MSEHGWGCLKQTAVGCGALIVLAIAIPLVLGVMVMLPMNRAVGARTEIERLYGTQDTFVPPAMGDPSADRIEAFLGVRRALASSCDDFSNTERSVAALEAFDDQDEVSRIAVMKQAFSTTRSMMGMGPLIGQFFETRNQALIEAEMGLGEYSYIYVLAYGDEIINPTEKNQLLGPGATNERVRRALQSMLAHQLDRLQQEGGPETDIAMVAAEVAALENDPQRIPWQDGLPPAITDALLPYREALDALFCGSTPPLELMINEKHGPAIETL
jgi:hypothetical protein